MPTESKDYKTDEITFKEAIHKSIEYGKEIRKGWWILLLFCIPFVALNLYKHFTHTKMFNASLTFMINEDSGSSMGALSSVLGQFGLGQSGEDNLDKILELSKSMYLSQRVLFEKETINNEEDFVGNHIIKFLEENNNWQNLGFLDETPHLNLENFRFSHDSIQNFGLLENKALKKLRKNLIGDKSMDLPPLLKTDILDGSNIMKFSARTYNPKLSVVLCNKVFDNLSSYYVDKATEKQQHTYKILETKTDSILTELKSKEYELANFKDRNRGLFAKTDQLTEVRLSRDVQKLSIMYGEATKNMELANFALQDNTPFIQLIDRPFLPIPPEKSSLLKRLLMGIFLGLLFGSCWIIGKKAWKEALQ